MVSNGGGNAGIGWTTRLPITGNHRVAGRALGTVYVVVTTNKKKKKGGVWGDFMDVAWYRKQLTKSFWWIYEEEHRLPSVTSLCDFIFLLLLSFTEKKKGEKISYIVCEDAKIEYHFECFLYTREERKCRKNNKYKSVVWQVVLQYLGWVAASCEFDGACSESTLISILSVRSSLEQKPKEFKGK